MMDLRRRRRLVWVLLAAAAAGVSGLVYWGQSVVRRELPAYLQRRLSAALGRPVSMGRVSFWPPGAFSVHAFRVQPGPRDPEPPLTANRLRAYVSWWDLVIHRRVRVTALHADQARVAALLDLRDPRQPGVDASSLLRSLAQVGLQSVGLHTSSAVITTIQPSGEPQQVTAAGIELVMWPRGERFSYRARVSRWSGAGVRADDVFLAGRGDSRTITLTESRARFSGGTVAARGSYGMRGGDVTMQVRVNGLPLAEIEPQLGFPPEWGVSGRLTGSMEVSALWGSLQRVVGTITVAPGAIARAQAVFPWQTATAHVDWQPEAVVIRNIDVQGNGIELRGQADVGGARKLPLFRRPFRARGTVEATSTQAVADMARLLAFSTPVRGRWGIERASIAFQATGIVGNLAGARANGRLSASGLMLRPRETGQALVIRSIQGDLERWPTHLHLRNVRAAAEGVTAGGALTITPPAAGRPGSFDYDGRMEFVNLAVLRQQLPELPLWQWVLPAGPGSRGSLSFAARGPLSAPEQMAGRGEFQFRGFGASVPTGQGDGQWQAPVRMLSGGLVLHENRLALRDVTLQSDMFRASGSGILAGLGRGGRLSGTVRLVSNQWRQLPPLRWSVPAELTGGTLVLEARVADPDGPARGRSVSGRAAISGASYRVAAGSLTRQVPLQQASADFRVQDGRVSIPSYLVVTPRFRTSGSGSAHHVALEGRPAGQWLLHGRGTLQAADAGELLRYWFGRPVLDGGRISAGYLLDLPSAQPERLSVVARVRLTDAQPLLAAGTLPFRPEDTRIVSLSGVFTAREQAVRFRDAVWQAPAFRAAGAGLYERGILDSGFRLTTSRWAGMAGELARALLISGGQLTVDGHVRGPADRLASLPFSGTLRLEGAQIAPDRNASVPARGGRLTLTSRVRGTLGRLRTADLNGSFEARDVDASPLRPGLARLVVPLARGRFRRSGTRVVLENLVARSLGGRVTGEGELLGVGTGSARHRFSFRGSGTDFSTPLPALAIVPGRAVHGRYSGWMNVSGTAAQPAARREARVEVRDARWIPPGQAVAMQIDLLSAHMVRRGSEIVLDDVELRTPGGEASLAGVIQDVDRPAAMRSSLRLTWRMENASAWASRFLPVPGWFSGGLFTGEARITGTAADPVRTASGVFQVRNAGFMPPERFLGGPVRPIDVAWARGRFEHSGSRTILRDLDLNTSVGTLTGQVAADERGNAAIRASGRISRLEALVDLWPGFRDRIQGGRGELTLDLKGPLRRPRELAGTVDLVARDGVLTVENVDELYATHPFELFRTRMVLSSDRRVALKQITMRGPKTNLDGKGRVQADGTLYGKGKAWFTESFSKKLVKPRFLWPLAKLAGFRRISSRWKVHGTLSEARLDLGITDSLAWKLGMRKRVPEPLRKIATGDAPLWQVDFADRRHVAAR